VAGTRRPKESLTDEQIRERIGCMLERPNKTGHLTAAVFVVSFFTLPWLLCPSSSTFRSTGVWMAGVLWTLNLVWTLVAAFGWKTLSPQELEQLSEEQRQRHFRLETIWFRVWKGGYLVLASVVFLLIVFDLLRPTGWVGVLAVGGYLLSFAVSFWQRRRILRVVVEGWSADTRWGQLMLLLSAIGPAVGASIGSGIGIVLVRLHVLPESILLTFAGVLGILVADMVLPQVVQDFSVAWIHFQIRRAEAKQAAGKSG